MNSSLELPNAYTLVELARTDDARAEAVRRARAGEPEGTLVWATAPESARARLGRPWLPAPDGQQLHAALILRPDLPADTCAELAVAAVLAIARALADEVEPVTELHYRWPNDLLLNEGKAGGVWLEAGGTTDSLDWMVIGWAVNTGTPPRSLDFAAAGIGREGGAEDVDPGALLQSIARHLLTWIDLWDQGEFAPLRDSWRGRLQLDQPIELRLPDGSRVSGTAEDTDETGSLTVRTDSGARQVTLVQFFGLPGTSDG
ncbi:MAG: biotin--[acetyl-CoA-carboxylase] ligase [Halofilum sp. (in: g-proteobacteria)]